MRSRMRRGYHERDICAQATGLRSRGSRQGSTTPAAFGFQARRRYTFFDGQIDARTRGYESLRMGWPEGGPAPHRGHYCSDRDPHPTRSRRKHTKAVHRRYAAALWWCSLTGREFRRTWEANVRPRLRGRKGRWYESEGRIANADCRLVVKC